MSYLLDTNFLSELRRPRRMAPNVQHWLGTIDLRGTYISALSVFELEYGAVRAERKGLSHAPLLREWIDTQILPDFEGRILPFDETVALRYARLQAGDLRPYADVMIAATALVHSLTVVTRNIDDFRPHGVALLNPWEAA